MDGTVIAAIVITIAVVITAIVALVAQGKMKAVARFLNLELEVDAGRDTPDRSAVIERGDAARDVEARSSGSATIRDTKAGRDIKAYGGDTSDPKR